MITLQLADVPFDADVANPQGRPLGTREQVARRLGELLPGATFDDDGRGTFQRGAYRIAFMMYGEPPTSIGVAFDQAEAFTPLARVVEKTGWCLIDPDAKGFVDLAASRAAGRTVLVGEEVTDLPDLQAGATAAAPVAAGPLTKPSAERLRGMRLVAAVAGLMIAAAALWGAFRWTGRPISVPLPASVLKKQSASAVRFEKYADRLRRRTTLMQSLPAPFNSNRIVEQMFDVQMASRAYWNFVDGRFTSPELLGNEAVWARFQMPSFLPASFGQRQRDGYEFEFTGEGCEESEPGWPECASFSYSARPLKSDAGPAFALFSADDKLRVRLDGRMPTKDDPAVDTALPATPK